MHQLRRVLRLTDLAFSFDFIGTIIAKPLYTFESFLVLVCKDWLWKITKIITAVRMNLNFTFLATEQKYSFVVGVS